MSGSGPLLPCALQPPAKIDPFRPLTMVQPGLFAAPIPDISLAGRNRALKCIREELGARSCPAHHSR